MATEDEEKKGFSASDILKVLGGIAALSAFGGTRMASVGGAGALGGGSAPTGRKLPTPTQVLLNTATTYPSLTEDFNYEVLWRPGAPWRNRSVDRQIARNSAVAQNIDEHNIAVANGTEQDLLPWWPTEDTKPRKEFGAGSSVIDAVKILPGSNKIMVHYAGKPSSRNPSNWYRYLGGRTPQESSEIVKELLISSSIGQALASNSNKGDNGWWAKKYYDESAANKPRPAK